MEWPADVQERRKTSTLIPYARNSRTHSESQVAQIAASIKEWGFTNPVLIDPDGNIIAGHGRVLAAQKLGLEEVPCIVAKDWTKAQKQAYVIADNKLAMNADWDFHMLKLEIGDLAEVKFDLDLTGFDGEEISDLFAIDKVEEDGLSENYSRKIEAPIYEITGDRPPVSELYDRTKADELIAEIDQASLPDEVAGFLKYAAERHTVFNFRNIAEFYAHADADVQRLMERSALVIIDFDKAVEEGFVKLSKQLLGLAGEEHG